MTRAQHLKHQKKILGGIVDVTYALAWACVGVVAGIIFWKGPKDDAFYMLCLAVTLRLLNSHAYGVFTEVNVELKKIEALTAPPPQEDNK